jgi:hypothetical protein
MRDRGIMTSRRVSVSNWSAREASSLACSWIAPDRAASSTSCSISSFETRASMKLVLSESGRSRRFELAVRNQTRGLMAYDRAESGRATTSA